MLDLLHLQYFFGALVSLVVITNPPSKIPLFVSLTVGMTREQRHQQANWAAIYSFLVMIVSLIAGNMLLAFFGISYSAMRIAGGLVIAMIGYQMLFGGNSPNNAPMVRRNKEDYAFFPIAMPGIAGPGTIAVVIGFSTEIAELTHRRTVCGLGHQEFHCLINAVFRTAKKAPQTISDGAFFYARKRDNSARLCLIRQSRQSSLQALQFRRPEYR